MHCPFFVAFVLLKLLRRQKIYDKIYSLNLRRYIIVKDGFEPKKLAIVRILQILEQYSDFDHPLTQDEILDKLTSLYGIELERKAVGKTISILQDMFDKDSMQKSPSSAIVLESNKRRGTYFDKRLFEDAEIRLLIDSVLASKHISKKYSADLIEKLCMLSNQYFLSHVKHICSVKDWDKTDNKSLFYNIETIDAAIEKGRQIQFDYNKFGTDKKLHKTSTHVASPYQLILHNQRYYLMFLSEKWKNVSYFRLDKITNVEILEEKPITPLRSVEGYKSGVDYKKIASSLPYMFTDKIEKIEFLAEEWMVDQVIDWFGTGAKFEKAADGRVKVTVMASPNAMEYWSMQYLNYVEIIAPTELRERIKKRKDIKDKLWII